MTATPQAAQPDLERAATPGPDASSLGTPRVSVVAPAHNEEENIERLVREVHDALAPRGDLVRVHCG